MELQGIKALDEENPQVAHCIRKGKAECKNYDNPYSSAGLSGALGGSG